MSDISELEARLRSHPDDWESWLVYADWLTEQGDEHGHLIVLEHKLATGTLDSRQQTTLERQIRALNKKNKWGGVQPLRMRPGSLRWLHGFIWGADLHGESSVITLGMLLDHPDARHLMELSLRLISSRDLSTLGQHLAKGSIRRLALSEVKLKPKDVNLLLGTRHLRTLLLSNCSLNASGAAVLASLPSLATLETLDLGSNGIGDKGAQALGHSEHLTGLTSLNLSSNNIGPKGAYALGCSDLNKLTALSLGENTVGTVGAEGLARGGVLQSLVHLDLNAARIKGAGAAAIAEEGRFPSLSRLVLESNAIGDAGVHAIASSKTLSALTELNLNDNGLTAAAAQSLARSPNLRNLRTLSLDYNALSDAGAIALGASTAMPSLTRLSLQGTELEDQGALAVGTSKELAALTWLGLQRNGLGERTQGTFASLRPELQVEWFPSAPQDDYEDDDLYYDDEDADGDESSEG